MVELDTDVNAVFRRLAAVIGEVRLDKRLAELERTRRQLYKDSGYVRNWFVPQNIVWSVLQAARQAWSRGEAITLQSVPEAQRELFARARYIAQVVVDATDTMPDARKRKLASDLCSAADIKAVLLECEVALYLRERGFDLQWLNDTGSDGARSAELIASNGNVEFAVECKATAIDAGRRFGRQHALLLADEFVALRPNWQGHLDITLEGPLPKTEWELQDMARAVMATLETGPVRAEVNGITVEGVLFERTGAVVAPEAYTTGIKSNGLDRFTYSIVLSSRTDALCDPLAIRFITPLKDKVTENLKSTLRDATDQLKASHSLGYVTCYLPEIADFMAPGIQEYLHEIGAWLFGSGSQRDHVFACMFVSDHQMIDTPLVQLFRLPWYVVVNPLHAEFAAIPLITRP